MAHVSLNHPKLTLEGAEAILDAAKAQAARIGVPMNIAVVDDGGYLLAFARMDGAKPASIDIAINKAHAAAIRRQNTGPARSGDEVSVLLVSGPGDWKPRASDAHSRRTHAGSERPVRRRNRSQRRQRRRRYGRGTRRVWPRL